MNQTTIASILFVVDTRLTVENTLSLIARIEKTPKAQIAIDLKSCQHATVPSLALLLSLRARLRMQGGDIVLLNVQRPVADLIQMYQLEGPLPVCA